VACRTGVPGGRGKGGSGKERRKKFAHGLLTILLPRCGKGEEKRRGKKFQGGKKGGGKGDVGHPFWGILFPRSHHVRGKERGGRGGKKKKRSGRRKGGRRGVFQLFVTTVGGGGKEKRGGRAVIAALMLPSSRRGDERKEEKGKRES